MVAVKEQEVPPRWKERLEELRRRTIERGIQVKELPCLVHKYYARLSISSLNKALKGQRKAREYAAIFEAVAKVWAEKEGVDPNDDVLIREYVREMYALDLAVGREDQQDSPRSGRKSGSQSKTAKHFTQTDEGVEIVWQALPSPEVRHDELYDDRDLITVLVTLNKGISSSSTRLQLRISEALTGFGIKERVVRLDEGHFRVETYVSLGTGFSNHVKTLLGDLKKVPGVAEAKTI